MGETIHISDLAGHGNELTAWQILKEVSQQAIERQQFVINPFVIEISDDGHFHLASTQEQHAGFAAPEIAPSSQKQYDEANTVWSLGATVFFVVLGQLVMNGKGGLAQTKTSKLPYMRNEWPRLSELVQQCLNYAPQLRPTLKTIWETATHEIERCQNDVKRGPKFKALPTDSNSSLEHEQDFAFWPESMQSTKVKQ